MSSADAPRPAAASLRTRLAVACVAVAVLGALVGGVWLSAAGHRYFREIARGRQLRMLRELQWEYLAGTEIPGPVPKSDAVPLPAAAADALPAPPVMAVRLPEDDTGAPGGFAVLAPDPDGGGFLEIRLRPDGTPAAPPAPCRTGDADFLAAVIAEKAFDNGPHEIQVLLLGPDGRERLRSPRDPAIVDAIADGVRAGRDSFRVRAPDDLGRLRDSKVYAAAFPDGASIALGVNLAHEARFVRQIALQLFLSLLVALLPALLAARWFSGRVVRAISSVSVAARAIASGDLRRRVPPSRAGRELVELGDAFNAMCDSNERLVGELRTLSDDIAHDLRTPLTRLRAAAELAATGGMPPDDLPPDVAAETDAMLALIEATLDVARAASGLDPSPAAPADLAAETRRVCDLYAADAEVRRLDLAVELPPSPVPVRGNAGRLQQLVGNLLDNALKFTPPGGRVAVALAAGGGRAVLSVDDSGPGVPPGERERVFRRFWRADAARATPGSGLGLALVRAVATGVGGRVRCLASPLGGARFEVVLPLAPSPGPNLPRPEPPPGGNGSLNGKDRRRTE